MTKQVIVTRFKNINDGTLGTLSVIDEDGIEMFFCYTLEPRGESTTERNQDRRIPSGSYGIIWHDSPKFGRELPHLYNKEVPKDRYILIHSGNYPKDTEGCILVGMRYTDEGVFESKNALERLIRCLREENVKVVYVVEDDEIQ